MAPVDELKIFTGNAHPKLTEDVCGYLGVTQGQSKVFKFTNDNTFVQILENLIANATYWLKLQSRYQNGFEPQIMVSIDADTRVVTIEDNGPGVDPARGETIFQPFITSKPAGQGRGLGLYISRELAEYNDWQLYMDKTPGRHREDRLSMFVIDMGGNGAH